MQCKKCGFENETTETYCKLCGARITFTVGRAESSLLDRATTQSADLVESELRRMLVLAIALFFVLVTVKVMYGQGNWKPTYLVPSVSGTGAYARIYYLSEPRELPADTLPIPAPK